MGDTSQVTNEQDLQTRGLEIKEREVKNNYRLSILKTIVTGIVATLVPATINWQIQNQNTEIERLKNERTYLMDFSKDALQEDLNKRYNFADYLATVAHSDESRKRWNTYREKIERLFDREAEGQRRIKELRAEIEDITSSKNLEESEKISQLQDEMFQQELDIRNMRKRYQTEGVRQSSDIVFTEHYNKNSIRFKVRNLNLKGEGNALLVRKGGLVEATMEIKQDCPECGTTINQIIVGTSDKTEAQSCVWNGLYSSKGWKEVAFTLKVPDAAGVYYIRARYAQANGCRGALSWWKVDRPNGPSSASNIGVVIVSP